MLGARSSILNAIERRYASLAIAERTQTAEKTSSQQVESRHPSPISVDNSTWLSGNDQVEPTVIAALSNKESSLQPNAPLKQFDSASSTTDQPNLTQSEQQVESRHPSLISVYNSQVLSGNSQIAHPVSEAYLSEENLAQVSTWFEYLPVAPELLSSLKMMPTLVVRAAWEYVQRTKGREFMRQLYDSLKSVFGRDESIWGYS